MRWFVLTRVFADGTPHPAAPVTVTSTITGECSTDTVNNVVDTRLAGGENEPVVNGALQPLVFVASQIDSLPAKIAPSDEEPSEGDKLVHSGQL
jgi:hypothetical protein